MADIRPFSAIRPTRDQAATFAALPYDVFDEKEAREYVTSHPGSFLEIDRAETQFEEGHDMYAPEVYEKARELLRGAITDGRLVKEDKPKYYVYRLTMDSRSQTGIVACASIDDYKNNVIKKHENTRAAKEQDRIDHITVTKAQTGPIFLAYRKNDVLSRIISGITEDEKPVYDFSHEDNIRHEVFVIEDDETISKITGIFASIDSIYIADGHHRCASAAKVGFKMREKEGYVNGDESDYFLSVLFPDSELKIYDYNRVVLDLNGLEPKDLIKKLSASFDVTLTGDEGEYFRPAEKGTFGLYVDHSWFKLSVKDEFKNDDPVKGLDVSLLQDLCLSPILGIDDPKTSSRIVFVGGIRGLRELEKRANAAGGCAFSMFPTSISELFDVADNGLLMPPKSTWFEPKLLSGLFIHDIQKENP